MRERYLDLVDVEPDLQPAQELPTHSPLTERLDTEAASDDDGGATETLNACELERFEQIGTEDGVLAQSPSFIHDDLHDMIDILAICDTDIDHRISEPPAHVRDGGDEAVRDIVDGTLIVAESDIP